MLLSFLIKRQISVVLTQLWGRYSVPYLYFLFEFYKWCRSYGAYEGYAST